MDKVVFIYTSDGFEQSDYDPNDGCCSCVRYYTCSGGSATTISFCTTRGALIR